MKTDRPEQDDIAALDGEIARIQSMIASPKVREMRKAAPGRGKIKPRNAATLLLIDGKPGKFRVLMGKRHKSLAFMPGALVFPGGRVDRHDGEIPAAGELDAKLQSIIFDNLRGRPSQRAARALGMAAIREMSEESGILIGKRRDDTIPAIAHKDWADFDKHAISPSLSGLSLLGRAITPPGPPRRFDTWFFAVRAEEIGHVPPGGFDPCGELEELRWLDPADAISGDTREITRVMLVELMNRLEKDPELSPDRPCPCYRSLYNRFQKSMMG